MHHANTHRRFRPDPDAAFLRDLGRRLDALRDLPDPSPDQRDELMYRLWVVWAHMQPTPVPRPARRRLGAPARLPAHDD